MHNEALIFQKSDGGRIKIDVYALKKINKFLQTERSNCEAGGVLLGRYIIDSNDIIVDDITMPMKNDIRHRSFFLRRKRLHQKVVTKRWLESKGTCNYLGEWHTHAEAIPTPSCVDIKEWKKLLSTSIFDNDCLYFIIAGTEKIRVWEGNKYTMEIRQLNEMSSWMVNSYEKI
ncbi:conserved hypothetical protein [Thermoanaerobacter italicus Ab9]|uniref:JAB domain-containing protein n=1 Tax=Thermoanaerobacter italicus (strain DSM 9252 / Ab9) TaxID=580331 RepID=D3T4G1_THEIA|nr:Mov34/MPN/PAD-1 family protein [Thermoanaerobacter italicus]ADD03113.1 conserved hypothetical protein [Thermoanaerobacter italicus Ab9]